MLQFQESNAVVSQGFPAVTIPSGDALTVIQTFDTQGIEWMTITGTVSGTGPITGLQLTTAVAPGGLHVPVLTNSDFSTATDTLVESLGLSSPTDITTGSTFQFTVNLRGVKGEVKLWAQSSAGAALALEVSQCLAPAMLMGR